MAGMEELVSGERDSAFVRFLVVNNSVKTGIGENGRKEIDDCVRVIRKKQGVNQKRNHNAG